MKVEEMIGASIRRARDEEGLSQSQLGAEMGKMLGKPWSRQAVSAAEAGGRNFTAVEIVALGQVLHRSPTWFFRAPESGTVLRLPSAEINADALFLQPGAPAEVVTEIDRELMMLLHGTFSSARSSLRRLTTAVAKQTDALENELDLAQRLVSGVERGGKLKWKEDTKATAQVAEAMEQEGKKR